MPAGARKKITIQNPLPGPQAPSLPLRLMDVCEGAVIPGVSEVLTFCGVAGPGASVCPPPCVYYSCPCEAGREGLLIERGDFTAPCRQLEKCAAWRPLVGSLMPFLYHPPAASLYRGFLLLFFSAFTVCVREVPGLKGSHLLFSPFPKLVIGSGRTVTFGAACVAPRVARPEMNYVYTQTRISPDR